MWESALCRFSDESGFEKVFVVDLDHGSSSAGIMASSICLKSIQQLNVRKVASRPENRRRCADESRERTVERNGDCQR